MRPPFPWNGAKTRLVGELTPYIKAWGGRGRWIEPFLGSGVVSRQVRRLYPNTQILAGDLNPWLVAGHQHWLSGNVEPPSLNDVSKESIARYRAFVDADFSDLSERDRALRFFVCLYSAWGNRWQTKDDGTFATPINKARKGGDADFLLRRLRESHGSGWFTDHDHLTHGGWRILAEQAEPGDLVFLDSPYPETAGYCVGWNLRDWSEMYLWVREAVGRGVHVLVCNPGTLALLWGLVMERQQEKFTPPQGRSTAPRVEYIGYHGPWETAGKSEPMDLMDFFESCRGLG